MDFEEIPIEWLRKELIVQACELEHAAEISKGDSQSFVQFVGFNEHWDYLKSLMLTNDEIWDFDSPSEHWYSLCGRSGVALVRNNKIIFTITSMMN